MKTLPCDARGEAGCACVPDHCSENCQHFRHYTNRKTHWDSGLSGDSSNRYLASTSVHIAAGVKDPLIIVPQFSLTHVAFAGLRDYKGFYLAWLSGDRIAHHGAEGPTGIANGIMV